MFWISNTRTVFYKVILRIGIYRLPLNIFPKSTVRYLALRVARNINYLPKKTGISKIFSPHTILKQKQVNFNKDFIHSFGEYVQATDDRSPQNSNMPRLIESIYLRAEDTLKGSHQLMNLAMGSVLCRPKVDTCDMMRMMIHQVELIVSKQGYKSLTFLPKR